MADASQFRRVVLTARALAVGLVASVAMVVVLGIQVKRLEDSRDEAMRWRSFPMPGIWVPTEQAVSTTGDTVQVGATAAGRSQLLIFFTTTCEFCLSMLEEWKGLSAELARDGNNPVDVIWVSGSNMDSTRAYVARHGITDPVVRFVSWKTRHVYRVKGVPMTMVLDQWGRVTHAHPSLFETQAARDSVLLAARAAAVVDTAAVAVSAGPSTPNAR